MNDWSCRIQKKHQLNEVREKFFLLFLNCMCDKTCKNMFPEKKTFYRQIIICIHNYEYSERTSLYNSSIVANYSTKNVLLVE